MFEMNKCPKCDGRVEEVGLLSNPPIYKKICENCGELNINDMIETINLQTDIRSFRRVKNTYRTENIK